MHPHTSSRRWWLPLRPTIAIAALVLIVASRRAWAEGELAGQQVRAVDPQVAALIADGARRSPSLRMLLDRIDRSNLIVHVECRLLPPSLAGRVTFVGTSHNWRYARIHIDCHLNMLTRLAILGHELQHAAEIADSADAVDDQSVEQLYQRIGFQMSESARQFDTAAARQMGERVLEELRSRPERQIAAR